METAMSWANIARFVAAEPGMLEARSKGEPRDLTVGPLIVNCANPDYAAEEQLVGPDEAMMKRGTELAEAAIREFNK